MDDDKDQCSSDICGQCLCITDCDEEEKNRFWEQMDDMIAMIPQEEGIWFCGDLIGHVGIAINGSSEIMGKCGMGKIKMKENKLLLSPGTTTWPF